MGHSLSRSARASAGGVQAPARKKAPDADPDVHVSESSSDESSSSDDDASSDADSSDADSASDGDDSARRRPPTRAPRRPAARRPGTTQGGEAWLEFQEEGVDDGLPGGGAPDESDLAKAQRLLTLAARPECLPCRDEEKQVCTRSGMLC